MNYLGNSFSVVCTIFFFVSTLGIAQSAPQFERDWAICDMETKPKAQAQERIEACNRVMAAGKTGGGVKDIMGTPRGVELYYGAYYDRSQAYIDLHRYDNAVADLIYFLEIAPTISSLKMIVWQAYAKRALAYYYAGNYDKALADLDNEDASSNETFHWGNTTALPFSAKLRGDVDIASGNYGAALEHYLIYEKVYPNDTDIAEKIASARQRISNPQLPPPVPSPLPLPSSDNPSPACKMYPNLC